MNEDKNTEGPVLMILIPIFILFVGFFVIFALTACSVNL